MVDDFMTCPHLVAWALLWYWYTTLSWLTLVGANHKSRLQSPNGRYEELASAIRRSNSKAGSRKYRQQQVGTGELCCFPRHHVVHFRPSFLELNFT